MADLAARLDDEGDDAAADTIRDLLDVLWKSFSTDERDEIRRPK